MSYSSFPAHSGSGGMVSVWLERRMRTGLGMWKGEKSQEPSLLFLSVQICIFLFPPEIQSNHQQTALKASSITNHLESHAQNIKPNSVTGLVGQINEATHRIRSCSIGIRASGIWCNWVNMKWGSGSCSLGTSSNFQHLQHLLSKLLWKGGAYQVKQKTINTWVIHSRNCISYCNSCLGVMTSLFPFYM